MPRKETGKKLTPEEAEANFELVVSGAYDSLKISSAFDVVVQVQPKATSSEIFRDLAGKAEQVIERAKEAGDTLTSTRFEGLKQGYLSTAVLLDKKEEAPTSTDNLRMTDPKR